jgi:hypothetical protein
MSAPSVAPSNGSPANSFIDDEAADRFGTGHPDPGLP